MATGTPQEPQVQAAVALALVQRLEARLERDMAELKAAIQRVEDRLDEAARGLTGRMSALERWRERTLGAAALIGTLAAMLWQLVVAWWRQAQGRAAP